MVALYFRFSLKDPSFNIYINENLVSIAELNPIKEKTQFVWKINGIDDPYINDGVFKKIIPTIHKYYGNTYYLLSVDDDWIYREDYIEMMINYILLLMIY